MTFEKKCFIKPEDILGIRFECGNCKSISTIPIDKVTPNELTNSITRACPYCQSASGFPYGTSELEHFIKFNSLLAQLKELMKGRNIQYGFEIKCDVS